MKRAIYWFRNDLRVSDNEGLLKCSERFDEVLPVYVFDERIFSKSDYGSKKIGSFRTRFIIECLDNLHQKLKQKGSGLLILWGDPVNELCKLCTQENIRVVYSSKEVAHEEKQIEISLRDRLSNDTDLKYFWGKTLFHPNDIPFEIQNIPDIYSSFRKNVEKYAKIRRLYPEPLRVNWPGEIDFELPTQIVEYLSSEKLNANEFRGGEEAANQRLNHYFYSTQSLSNYKNTRNGLLGLDYSSKFSPWLAQGCISPRQIYFEVKRYETEIKKNVSTYWLIFELIWRDYFNYVLLKYGNKLFYPGGIKEGKTEVYSKNLEWLKAWKKAKTGIPFIDANMRELNSTGFMSNRGRQNVASFLLMDLGIDWRYGAAYFEEMLVDYDVASNWGNWAYVAGVGNDPRENRYFNIMSQADRYDGKGEYVKSWLPELGAVPDSFIHKPWIQSAKELENQGLTNSPYAQPIFVPDAWKL